MSNLKFMTTTTRPLITLPFRFLADCENPQMLYKNTAFERNILSE